MSTLEELADFVAHVQASDVPESVRDRLRLHLFDTIVAMVVGRTTEEGKAATRLIESSGIGLQPGATGVSQAPPSLRALHMSTVTRCTEIDDIHLESCTTPGSVVVPTALALAEWHKGCSAETFLTALLVGYESMVRFGKAVDGPRILYKGIWPTCLAAGLAAASTTARFMGLSAEETASALAAVLSLAPVWEGRPVGPIASRWLKLGCAVQDGILAALGSSVGFRSDLEFLDRIWADQACIPIDQGKLVEGLGKSYEFDKLSIKPYCAAKQVTSAIYGFLDIIDCDGIDPSDIRRVAVRVPPLYANMIGMRGLPEGRLQSIISAAYQLALAAKHRPELRDVQRSTIHAEREFQAFMDMVHVEVDDELECAYPAAWPALVKVETDKGHFDRQVHHTKGDPTNPFQWSEVTDKAAEVGKAIQNQEGWNSLARLCRELGRDKDISDVLEAMHELETKTGVKK